MTTVCAKLRAERKLMSAKLSGTVAGTVLERDWGKGHFARRGDGDFVQGVAAGGGAADADEQPRPGGGGAAGRVGVYGGTGKAARNWECFHAIVRSLKALEADETLLVQSGKPVGFSDA